MTKQAYRSMMVWCLMSVLAILPISGMAQEELEELPVLVSTGMPTAGSPEDALPKGAIAYVRANNVLALLEDVDSLLTTFVPETTLPPDMQEVFAGPQPFLTFFSMQAFGQAVPLNQLSDMVGIALDRPVALAFYPLPPQQGFLLSLPIVNATVVTGMVQSMLEPDSIEKGLLGDIAYYHIVGSNYDLPQDVYLAASEDTVYICGSMQVLQMLTQSADMGTLASDPVIADTIAAYGGRDLTLTLSPGMLKSQLPGLKDMAAGMVNMPFMQARMGLQMIPPAQRLTIDSRLRLEFGIDGLAQLVEYAEAYASGAYRVLLDHLVASLMKVDGVSLSVDLEEAFHTLAFTLFSATIQPDSGTLPLPLDTLPSALNALPGDKTMLMAVGQTPIKEASPMVEAVLAAIEEELAARSLSTEGVAILKDFYAGQPRQTPLTARSEWTLRSALNRAEPLDLSQFASLDGVFSYLRMQAGRPFMIPVTLLPAGEPDRLARHYADKADHLNQQGRNYAALRSNLPFRPPAIDVSGAFRQEEVADGVSRLTLDTVYTSRHGLFGYQQHVLVNRRIMLHQQQDDYDVLYATSLEADEVLAAADANSAPLPGAMTTLLAQLPQGTTHVSALHLLHWLPRALDLLVDFEDLTHREFDAFLGEARQLIETSGPDAVGASMVDAGLMPPFLLASLNVTDEGAVYATLPTGLHYPRPKVMPQVRDLFAGISARASDIGGGAAVIAVRPGAWEVSSISSTAGLALLVKSVGNAFFKTYMMAPDGMEKLAALRHPQDFEMSAEDAVFVNPFWEFISEDESFPWVAAAQQSKQNMTVASIRALATSLEMYQVDEGYFPKHPQAMPFADIDLPDDYFSIDVTRDGWDHPILYLSDEAGENYLLLSYGNDGRPGFSDSDFDEDIAFMNGWLIAPYMLTEGDDTWDALNAALIMAVQADAYDVVESLLYNDADPNAETADGVTALQIAMDLELTEIAELLQDWGAYLPEE